MVEYVPLPQITGIDQTRNYLEQDRFRAAQNQIARRNALEDKQRALARLAGNALASGNIREAGSIFARGGDIENWTLMQKALEHADDRALADAQRKVEFIGNMALGADTPEKWAQAIQGAKVIGADVSKYESMPFEQARQIALAQAKKTQAALEAELKRRGEGVKFGMNPMYYTDEAGNLRIGQLSSAGGLKPVDVPGRLAPALTIKDTGTEETAINPRTGAVVSSTPKNVSGAAEQKELGQEAAKAKAMLPSAESTVDSAIRVIDKLRRHPGLDWSMGWAAYIPSRYGSAARNFEVMNEQAQAKAFMVAREALKGAGQVTDFEGRKGEEAIVKLSRAQSKEQYLEMLDELEKMMNASLADLQRKAGLGSGGQARPAPESKPDPLGIR